MADQTTKFRLDTIEARLKTLGDRLHDIATLAHESKLRLDTFDIDVRLRKIEAFIDRQEGRAMQNKIVLGIFIPLLGALGGLAMELIRKLL